jgi:hypothetical protein
VGSSDQFLTPAVDVKVNTYNILSATVHPFAVFCMNKVLHIRERLVHPEGVMPVCVPTVLGAFEVFLVLLLMPLRYGRANTRHEGDDDIFGVSL